MVIDCLKDQGFPAEIHPYREWTFSQHDAFAHALALSGKNVFITGFALTGKTRLALKIANDIESQHNKNVLCTAATKAGTYRIKGLPLFQFLGIPEDSKDINVDQAESIIERRMQQVGEKYARCLPTLREIDVLIIDEGHLVTLTMLQAIDRVARRLRPDHRNELFGGIQIIFLANFFLLDPSLDVGYHGFLYQSNLWREAFPFDQQVALRDSSERGSVVEKAHFGSFGRDEADALAKLGNSTDKIEMSAFVDDFRGKKDVQPFFARHEASCVFNRYFLRSNIPFRGVDAGHILYYLSAPMAYATSLGLSARASFTAGMVVQFNYGNGSTIEAGDIAIIKEAYTHCLIVTLPFKENRQELVYAMRVRLGHPKYPDAHWTVTQFPLVPRRYLSKLHLQLMHTPTKFADVDPRWVLGPNTLGYVLSKLDAPVFQSAHISEFLDRDNLVHEPTKVAFEELYQVGHPEAKRYCKNCKTNIATLNFEEAHWRHCVSSARWCKECSLLIPHRHWESHSERHTLVKCFDCRRLLEWRNWDIHRLTCPGVLKEISPDNPYIPVETRSLALAQGHDSKDIHSM